MAVVSGPVVSGLWRAGSSIGAAIPLRGRSCGHWPRAAAAAAASRALHYDFSSPSGYRQQQQCGARRRGKRCTAASTLIFRNDGKVSSRQNWIQERIGSESLSPMGSNWKNTHLLGRGALLLGDGVHRDVARKAWTPVRGMASLKAKEQPRGSLWRTRSVISKETVQAVHDLKRFKDNPVELAKLYQTRIPRLLKMDLLATLSELQRQNEIELALQIFDVVRKEMWYKPDQFLYRSLMDALGRNRRIAEIEKKFQELQDEGITPEVPIYRELVGAYVRAHMLPQALETHAKMVEIGCGDDRLSLQFIEIGKEKEFVRLKQRRKAAEKLKAEQEGKGEGEGEEIPKEVEIEATRGN